MPWSWADVSLQLKGKREHTADALQQPLQGPAAGTGQVLLLHLLLWLQ